jgi:hypothetical protein
MGVVTTQGIKFQLVAGNVILDLFQDEEILLSDNVTGIFDLGVVPADFTRQISLPGSKKNNAFFQHVYDISVLSPDTFATNVKVPCYIDFNGLYLAQGYLQLNKVSLHQNKFIDSYEVTIYGAVSSFAREINRTFLTDLNSLGTYNHTSSLANISASWGGNLFNGDIVYPLADYGQALRYTSGDIYSGIDDAAVPSQAMAVEDFKPAIRVKKVWDAIFDYAGYTYTGSFFDQPFLDDMYMICNRQLKYPVYQEVDLETLGLVKIAPISASGQTDLLVASSTNTAFPWYNALRDPSNVIGTNAAYTLTVTSSLQGVLNLSLKLSGSIGGPSPSFLVLDTGSLAVVSSVSLPVIRDYFYDKTISDFAAGTLKQDANYEVATAFATPLLSPGTYYFGFEWTDIFNAPYNDFTLTLDPGGKPKSYLEINKVRQGADNRIMNIPLNMPYGTRGIKLVDFITSIQKKFNLVMYPSKTVRNQFVVETFNQWYNRGRRWDFNKYINLDKKIDVIPANNFAVNELNFGDTLDTDYVSQQFSKGANREYGKSYYVDQQNFFSQGKFEVKTSVSSTPLLYLQGTGLSGSIAGITPEPGQSFVYNISQFGYNFDYEACTQGYYGPQVLYADTPNIFQVVRFFTNAARTTPFNGSFNYWLVQSQNTFEEAVIYIASQGYVANVSSCGGGGGGGTSFF